jgi:Raf kinase inhibitor-like YbhB/YbcL family protein
MQMSKLIISLLMALLLCGVFQGWAFSKDKVGELQVISPAFLHGGNIPKKYTCDGKDISPPLKLGSVPEGTKSIALIMDDPDAPGRTWIHWVLFNLAPNTKELPEAMPAKSKLEKGAIHGLSSWGRRKIGYGGPCPPSGTHRYFFKVYALDKVIERNFRTTKVQLLKAMQDHILAQGELMGTYRRK